MRATDIETLVAVGRPTMARDGSFAIFATSRPSLEANRNVGQLHRIGVTHDADTGWSTRRPLTRGVADSAPRLSPDDTRVAFLRGDAKQRPQVWVVEAGGGEPVQVTDAPLGVQSFAWAPDGTRLAFTAAVPEPGRYGSIEGMEGAAEAPRHITGIRWHANGLGYIGDRPAHVFLVDAPDLGAEPAYEPAPALREDGTDAPKRRTVPHDAVALTSGERSFSGAVFTADGGAILTVPDEIEPRRRDLRQRLVAVAVDGSGEREVVGLDARLSIFDVAVAADGTIALIAAELGDSDTDFVAPAAALWVLDGGALRRLTDPEVIDLGEVGSHLTPIGEDFLVQNRTRGRVHLLRVDRSATVRTILDGDVEVNGHAASDDGHVLVSLATPQTFGELACVTGERLTHFGDGARAAGIVVPDEVELPARDGYPVHGWVATPAGDGPFPVILQIHGGPYASYGIHLFDETQVLVDAGYAVVYANPRGSAGYGRAHGRAIMGAMGTVDFTDVIDFLDGVLARDTRLDGARVGVMGGSYGGYLTAWVIAHDHRFAGAIVERGFLDPVSFQGTSDIGTFFGDEYVGVASDDMARQSPMAVVDQVRTPTFVIHSEQDYRCPLEQATRYYSALKRGGVDAEMLIFPGENHELTRAGQPRHRVERFAAVLDWWARHLPVQD